MNSWGVRTGQLRLGEVYIKNTDRKRKLVWKVEGRIVVQGTTLIGQGCTIDVKKEATLFLGKDFQAVGLSTIICHKGISFGKVCLMSWDCLIMDRDYHSIYDESKKIINSPKPIEIGNNVWIGCRSTILKGVSIGNSTVIAACSLMTKSSFNENVVISGNGSEIKILKKHITWNIKEEL